MRKAQNKRIFAKLKETSCESLKTFTTEALSHGVTEFLMFFLSAPVTQWFKKTNCCSSFTYARGL